MEFRKDLINFFIEKFNYQTYLEIGVKSQSKTFDHINCAYKEGVDPNGCTTHRMTSDEFFSSIDSEKRWDIIFVDGYHERAQVKRDIEHALLHLSDNGTIVCHDVNPREEWLLDSQYCWNAWEAFAELRATRKDLKMYSLTFDHLGFIQKGSQEIWPDLINHSWSYLNTHRATLMNEISTERLREMYK